MTIAADIELKKGGWFELAGLAATIL